jgi:23S rRNA (pseudouridine1915-N3)-methyltransferase
MKISLLQTGKTGDKNIAAVADQYINRIRKQSGFEIVTIPDLRNTRNMSVRELRIKEGKRIIQSLSSDDYVVLLDERGTQFRTTDFSAWMGKVFMLSKKRIVFVIGGSWGFSEEVYDRADFRISLSAMTFPHELVRLLFLEQMYRAFTIINGEPYHHE